MRIRQLTVDARRFGHPRHADWRHVKSRERRRLHDRRRFDAGHRADALERRPEDLVLPGDQSRSRARSRPARRRSGACRSPAPSGCTDCVRTCPRLRSTRPTASSAPAAASGTRGCGARRAGARQIAGPDVARQLQRPTTAASTSAPTPAANASRQVRGVRPSFSITPASSSRRTASPSHDDSASAPAVAIVARIAASSRIAGEEPSARRAEGRADGRLAPAACAAHEQQRRRVREPDDEDEERDARQARRRCAVPWAPRLRRRGRRARRGAREPRSPAAAAATSVARLDARDDAHEVAERVEVPARRVAHGGRKRHPDVHPRRGMAAEARAA